MPKFGLRQKILLIAFGILISLIFLEVISRIFIKLPPNLYGLDPILGYKLIPNAASRHYKINSKGLRDTEHDYRRNYPSLRIITLGDSFTMGTGVDNIGDIYPKIIERELSNIKYPVEVINLGVGGYNTYQEVNFFKTEGIKYSPDLVILTFFVNDKKTIPVDISLIKKLDEYHVLRTMELFRRNIYTLKYVKDLIRRAIRTYFKQGVPEPAMPVSTYNECIRQIIDFSLYLKAREIKLMVFLLPEVGGPKDDLYAKIYGYIEASLRENNVACYDLSADFKALKIEPKSLWVSCQDRHLNELGHKYLARFILSKLKP